MAGAVRAFLRAGIVLACLIGQAVATAGAIQVAPTRIVLSAQQPTAVLTVRNESAEASVMQIETVSWRQTGSEDQYTPTREVLATPPIFTVQPGGSQIVRVGLRRQPDSIRELAYRIFIQEVPTETRREGEVRVALRFGIPVFVAPAGQASKPLLEWRIVAAESPGQLRIEAINRGDVHVQIAGFSLAVTGGPVLAEQNGMKYLLPGQSHGWVVRPNQALPPGTRLRIVARTDAGEIQTEVLPEG